MFVEMRNTRGADRLFVGKHHPSHDFLEALYEEGGSSEVRLAVSAKLAIFTISIIRVMTSLKLCTKRGAAHRYDWQSPLNSLSSLSVSSES